MDTVKQTPTRMTFTFKPGHRHYGKYVELTGNSERHCYELMDHHFREGWKVLDKPAGELQKLTSITQFVGDRGMAAAGNEARP